MRRRGGEKSSNSTYAPGSKMAINLQLWPNIGFNVYIHCRFTYMYLLCAGLKDQCQKIDSKICMANQGRSSWLKSSEFNILHFPLNRS